MTVITAGMQNDRHMRKAILRLPGRKYCMRPASRQRLETRGDSKVMPCMSLATYSRIEGPFPLLTNVGVRNNLPKLVMQL